jgi:hypothetical protein
MDEGEFDALTRFRPFGVADARRAEAQAHRCTALGMALWGKGPDDLQHQLLASHPEIPAGFDLDDFRELENSLRIIAVRLGDPRQAWLSNVPAFRVLCSPVITVGTERMTALEARCEIVRRAIEYLEGR